MQKRIKKIEPPMFSKCPFCESKTRPDYKKYSELEKFLSSRKRILPASRSGVCNRHQRLLTLSVKRARYLGLMPFVEKM